MMVAYCIDRYHSSMSCTSIKKSPTGPYEKETNHLINSINNMITYTSLQYKSGSITDCFCTDKNTGSE